MASFVHKRVIGVAAGEQALLPAHGSPAISIASAFGGGPSTSKKRGLDSVSATHKGGMNEGAGDDGDLDGVQERIAKRARLNSGADDGAQAVGVGKQEARVERSIDLDADIAYLKRWETEQLVKKKADNKKYHIRKVVRKTLKDVVESLASGQPYIFKQARTRKRKAESEVGCVPFRPPLKRGAARASTAPSSLPVRCSHLKFF